MEAPFDRLLAIFILKTHYPSGRTWAETFVVRLVMRLDDRELSILSK